jgi:prophage regulatory protein
MSGILVLERAGLFPRHFYITESRIAWYLDEILQWMQDKVDARSDAGTAERIEITAADRFIDFWETSTRVLLTPRCIYKLERAGAFPIRISLGTRRVGYLEKEVLGWVESRAAERLGSTSGRFRAP